jgi:phage terminase large subunit
MEAPVSNLDLGYHRRDVFAPFHDRTERWTCIIAHRRCGKTVATLMDLLDRALAIANGRFAYIAPLRNQAKTVAWDYLKEFSRPVWGKPPNEAELHVDLANGSRITLFGADNPDALRGPFFDGVVLDEFADMPPSLFTQIVRPALADRQGFAIVIGTIKGRNQLWELYTHAKITEGWYTALLRASETHVLPEEELANARRMMTPESYAAEFECDPYAAILGAYYGKEIAAAEISGRISETLAPIVAPIHTAWDLGNGANMAIWAFQIGDSGPLVQDFVQIAGFYFEDYCNELNRRGYHGNDYVPHDARVKAFESGRTRVQTMVTAGRKPVLIEPHKVEDGINAAKMTLRIAKFNAIRCERGIEALRQYRQEWDEKLKVFMKTAKHDWTSHGADAWRYLAMAWRSLRMEAEPEPERLYIPNDEMSIGQFIGYSRRSERRERA